MSKATELYKKKYLIALAISWALTIVPLLVFGIMGMCDGSVSKTEGISLGFTLIVVLFMSVVNIFQKINMKMTLIWGMMLVFYLCIDNLLAPILTVFICTCLNELVVERSMVFYKRKYNHNKDEDEREKINGKEQDV